MKRYEDIKLGYEKWIRLKYPTITKDSFNSYISGLNSINMKTNFIEILVYAKTNSEVEAVFEETKNKILGLGFAKSTIDNWKSYLKRFQLYWLEKGTVYLSIINSKYCQMKRYEDIKLGYEKWIRLKYPTITKDSFNSYISGLNSINMKTNFIEILVYAKTNSEVEAVFEETKNKILGLGFAKSTIDNWKSYLKRFQLYWLEKEIV